MSTIKNKPSLFLILLSTLMVQLLFSPTSAKVFQSDKTLGTCSGTMESEGVGEISKERKKQEKDCEPYDNKEKDCKRQSECKWVAKPKVCEAINEDKPDSEEDALFCDAITDEKTCLKSSLRCAWGYKEPVCSAVDASSKDDIELCEKYDGTSERQCERSEKCRWD